MEEFKYIDFSERIWVLRLIKETSFLFWSWNSVPFQTILKCVLISIKYQIFYNIAHNSSQLDS